VWKELDILKESIRIWEVYFQLLFNTVTSVLTCQTYACTFSRMLKHEFCRYAARHRSEIPLLIDTWFPYQLKNSTQKHSSRVFIRNIFSLEFIFWAFMKVKLNDFIYLRLPFLYIYYWQLTISRLQMVYSVTQYAVLSQHSVLSDCHMVPRYTRKFNFSYPSIRKERPSLFRNAKKKSRMIKSIIDRSLVPHFARNCNKCKKMDINSRMPLTL